MNLRRTLLAWIGVASIGAAALAEATYPPEGQPWRWGARIDESMFAPGGAGVTIHAAPDGKPDGDGSEAKPFDLATAVNRAGETMRSMGTTYAEGKDAVALPVWLRLVRQGDRFASYVAADVDGKAGEWRPVGEPTNVRMGGEAWVGLMVNNADSWPSDKTVVNAKADRVSLNGRTVDAAAWSVRRVGMASPVAEGHVDGDTITLRGGGYDQRADRRERNFIDAGVAALTRTAGDFEIVARVTELAIPAGRHTANVSLVARQPDDVRMRWVQGAYVTTPNRFIDQATSTRMAYVQVAASRKDNGPVTHKTHAGWRHDLDKPGRDACVLLKPGVYRLKKGIELPHRDIVAREKTFVVEGQRDSAGGVGWVVVSGSQTEGWQADTWKRDADGSFAHEWTQTWGGDTLAKRRECIYLTPLGRERIRLAQVLSADWKNEPGTFAVDESAKTIRMALPKEVAPETLTSTLVETPLLTDRGLFALGNNNPAQSIGNNVVFRNLILEHFAGTSHALDVQFWLEPHYPPHGLLIEDVTIRENVNGSFKLYHVRDFTFRRLRVEHNGSGGDLIAAEGQFMDCSYSHNGWRTGVGRFMNAVKNTLIQNTAFTDNRGTAFRNDHVAENLVFDRCDFARNVGQSAVILETAIGPVTFRDCTFTDNNPGGGRDKEAAVNLMMVANLTFERCTFTNNNFGSILQYPRERAHSAVEGGRDELCNNLDVFHWDTDNNADGRTTPGGKKPGNGNRNIVIRDCTFVADGPEDRFLVQTSWQRPEGYRRLLAGDLRAYNNRYDNPNCKEAFELGTNTVWGEKVFGTFDQWKKLGGDPDFEAGSAWGETTTRNFKPTEPTWATTGHTASGTKLASGAIRYEVEALPFTANRPVELLTHTGASGDKLHKLIAEQVGDYGGQVTYSLDVPAAGDYYITVRYLRHNAPFEYLGYAQLSVDGKKLGEPWDQCGLTSQFTTIPFGPIALAAGTRDFRFDAVWRNGYHSGAYDITVDAIDLSSTLDAQPPTELGQTRQGLAWQMFEGNWDRLPDFAKLQPSASGIATQPEPSVAPKDDNVALRFTGFITVPADGIWRFDTVVNDGANLYVGDQRVIDSDGVHDGEKNEPWRKWGFVALKAGAHPVRIDYFNRAEGKGRALEVRWQGPGVNYGPVPDGAWSHDVAGDAASAGAPTP
jgi:hypothetical protein